MAEKLDVTARLAEGRPAVDTIGDYVWACHLLGYQNADLTLHAGQVRDWYSSEDGLDLGALEADRAALNAAAAAIETAQTLQEQQLDVLTAAWLGRGGDASREFLRRHGDASSAAATAARDAAAALGALRDELWQAVDDKVASVVEIDARPQAERAQWQAASQTVTTGAGDRAAASELVDQQVKPFVDNDIRSDWLTAMQKAMTAVSAAFDTATAVLTGAPAAPFEVPGDLGPSSIPSPSADPFPPPVEAAGSAPAAWAGPAPAAAPGAGPAPSMAAPAPAFPAAPEPLATPVPAATAPPSAPTTPSPAMPGVPSLGEIGGALPGAAGGLAGLGTQLADAIGGLFDRPDDGLPHPPGLDDGDLGQDDALDEEDDPKSDDEDAADNADDESDSDAAELAETEPPGDAPADPCEEQQPVDEPAQADPAPTPPPTPVEPPQPIVEPPVDAAPLGAETPCEIAADELPQAGP